MIDLDTYLVEAEKALMTLLKEWHPKLMAHFGEDKYSVKTDKTVVTELDKELELAIKDVLRPLSPEVGFWGEEHGKEGPEDIFWFVDPIDGTELYIRGLDGCRTLLCLMMNDEPVYAFAYKFVTGELYKAQKGKGTTKNGKPVHITNHELSRAWVEGSLDMRNPKAVEALLKVSAAVNAVLYTKEFLRVLDGFADAHIISGAGGPWDYAPRALLMKEAGAKVSNIGSDTYDYKNLTLLAASPGIFDALHKLLSIEA
jgi:myo-inositol-1(or 4)-monophosphatase